MKTVLIAGAGQLGSRHLQALSHLDVTFEVWVYDVSTNSLEVARERYQQVAIESSPKVTFTDELPKALSVDVCIIATNSAIRYQLMKDILESNDVKYMLLEKVLFQTLSELESASHMLEQYNTKAWVNCPRRMYTLYQDLKVRLSGKRVDIKVTGQGWGLACNAVHYIDLWHYLNESELLFSASFLDGSYVVDSKRAGYKEVIGIFNANAENYHSALVLECEDGGSDGVSFEIVLDTIDESIVINEIAGTMTVMNKHTQATQQLSISTPFQSGLTLSLIHI